MRLAERRLDLGTVTCTAGAMMWEGISPRSWMMYSPRSVSTGVMPFAARWSLIPHSSAIIVLPLLTVRAPALRQMSSTMRRASSAVSAQCTSAAAGDHLRLVGLEVEVEVGQHVRS